MPAQHLSCLLRRPRGLCSSIRVPAGQYRRAGGMTATATAAQNPRSSGGSRRGASLRADATRSGAGSRGAAPPTAGTPDGSGAASTVAQQSSRRAFYQEASRKLVPRPALRSGYDQEIFLLFLPALVAGILEPLQQSAESVLVGRLGVSQASLAPGMASMHRAARQVAPGGCHGAGSWAS